MRVELQDTVSKMPPSVNMNNECAPSSLPTVPTCKWDLHLQVKVAPWYGDTGHMGPSCILQKHPSGWWRACNSQENGDLPSHMDWQHWLALRDSRAAARPTKIMLHTSATTAGGITHVSQVSGHQPAAAGGQWTLPVLYRALHKSIIIKAEKCCWKCTDAPNYSDNSGQNAC